MSTGYYCEDHPNPNFAQYGWPRTRVSGVIGVHTTESGVYFDGPDSGAENTAGYIGIRTTPGSYHVLADWDTRIKLVRPTFAAWADITNNAHALSVSGAMNAARWRDLPPERAAAIVRNMGIAAAELVQDAIANDVLDEAPPARRITAQQAIDGTAAGFYGHGETNPGTRYDPGTNFDWDLFLSTYAAAVGGTLSYASSESIQEDDMAIFNSIDEFKKAVGEAVQESHTVTRKYVVEKVTENTEAQHVETRKQVIDMGQAQEDVTRDYITDRVREASPGELVAAIPDDIAQQVIDGLAERLAGDAR